MPNHITNEVHANKEVLEAMLNKDGEPDFRMIIPYSEDLDLTGHGVYGGAETAAELICGNMVDKNLLLGVMQSLNRENIDVTNFDDDIFNQFIEMVFNKRKHGFYHSMDFTTKEWGTKWNAYETEVSDDKIRFDTAWASPKSIFIALSKKFPAETIQIRYADEDTGCNCGEYSLKNGEILNQDISENYSNQTKEEKRKWRKFATTLKCPNCDKSEFGFDENWDYIDD